MRSFLTIKQLTKNNLDAMRFLIGLILLAFITISSVQAQTTIPTNLSPEQAQQLSQTVGEARAEIKQKGLDEAEVKARMKEKGVDLDNLNPATTSPEKVEAVFNEVVSEMEQEQQTGESASQADTVVVTVDEGTASSNEIVEAIEEAEGENADAAAEVEDVIEDSALNTEEIIDDIEEGKSVEEAVADAIIEEAAEDDLPSVIYGQQLFRDGGINEIEGSLTAKPPKTYVLGVGDQIAISIFGESVYDQKLEIDENGFITPNNGRKILLRGKNLEEAREALYRVYSTSYRFNRGQFTVTLDVARTITVSVVGEAERPGPYTISALNTALNAIAAAGGPKYIGSLRNIELRKTDGSIKKIDIYEYLQNPSAGADYSLENNDIIFIPLNQKLVTIGGGIKRPYIYELKPDENLLDLIGLAGGFTADGYQDILSLRRLVGGKREIRDINYTDLLAKNQDFELRDADVINVRVFPDRLENFVAINGAVELPGDYELMDDMRLLDLVNKSILQREAKTDAIFVSRNKLDGTSTRERVNLDTVIANPASSQNILLAPRDVVSIGLKSEFANQGTISVIGAVRTPNENISLDSIGDIRVEDALILAGGLTRTASPYAYLIRQDFNNPEEDQYIPINLDEILADPTAEQNIELQPFDRIEIFDNTTFSDTYNVSISGNVRNGGSFSYSNGMTLRDLILNAGGLQENAYYTGYIFRRNPSNIEAIQYLNVDVRAAFDNPDSPENIELLPIDDVRILSNATFTDQFNITVAGEVRSPGTFEFDESLTLKDALLLSGGLKLEAAGNKIDVFRLVVEDNEATQTIAAQVEVDDSLNITVGQDFRLQPFDLVVVRRIPDFDRFQNITINGEVRFPGLYPIMDDNERLFNFIQRAGGLTIEAFPEGSTLFREEGGRGVVLLELDKVIRNKNSRYNYILKPGDVITIPKQQDLVAIKGAVKYKEIYTPDNYDDALDVPYHRGKRAKFYINKYASGVSDNGKKSLIVVEQPSGRIDRTVNALLFNFYPKVEKGAVITVGVEPPKPVDENQDGDTEKFENREPIDWAQISRDVIGQVTSIISLIVILERLPND